MIGELSKQITWRPVRQMNGTFKDKSVIITGAPSGIGKQLAFQMADEGAWLALAARNVERLEKLAEECIQRGGKATGWLDRLIISKFHRAAQRRIEENQNENVGS